MNKLLSCHFNMDTNRMEARFEGSTTVAIRGEFFNVLMC